MTLSKIYVVVYSGGYFAFVLSAGTGLGHRLDSINYQYRILGIDNLVRVRYNLSLLIDPGELMALGLSNLTVSGKAAAGTVVGPLERH